MNLNYSYKLAVLKIWNLTISIVSNTIKITPLRYAIQGERVLILIKLHY